MNSKTEYYDYILSGYISTEIIRNKLNDYFNYCKIYTRIKADENKDKTIEEVYKNNKDKLCRDNTFIDESKIEMFKKNIENINI